MGSINIDLVEVAQILVDKWGQNIQENKGKILGVREYLQELTRLQAQAQVQKQSQEPGNGIDAGEDTEVRPVETSGSGTTEADTPAASAD